MTSLANELERQSKFNSILRDKIDILNYRIEQLEVHNNEQAARISALSEARELEELPQSITPAPTEPAPAGPAVAPTTPELKDERQVQAPKPNKPSAPDTKGKGDIPPDFKQFLNMGEAMMRRFFGVVKEFREEFENNRA